MWRENRKKSRNHKRTKCYYFTLMFKKPSEALKMAITELLLVTTKFSKQTSGVMRNLDKADSPVCPHPMK
jgi:hypothetical protein